MEYQYIQLPVPGPWPTVDPLFAGSPPNFDPALSPDQGTDQKDTETHIIVIQL